jgi:hypothetical protein
MSTAGERADIAMELANIIAMSFEELEKSDGGRLPELLAEACLYDAKLLRVEGRQAFKDYLAKRDPSVRAVSRHLFNNPCFDFSDWEGDGQVTVRGVMTHYAGSEVPAVIGHPFGIYDCSFTLRRGGAFGWEFHSMLYSPVFMASEDVIKAYVSAQAS